MGSLTQAEHTQAPSGPGQDGRSPQRRHHGAGGARGRPPPQGKGRQRGPSQAVAGTRRRGSLETREAAAARTPHSPGLNRVVLPGHRLWGRLVRPRHGH